MTRKREVQSSNFQRRSISRHFKKIVITRFRLDTRGEELKAAIKLLRNVTSFSDARCRVYKESEPVLDAMWKSPIPRLQAFSWFDAHAHNYVGLINNADVRDAYLIILNQLLFPVAYTSLFGLPNLVPTSAEGLALLAMLEKKLRGWQHDAFSRTRTNSPALPTTGTTADSGMAPCAMNWGDIEILFVSEDRVQITTSNQTETRNYAEMDFEDGRNGKPNRAWLALLYLAQARGIIGDSAKAGQDWSRMEKIRKVLRSHFGHCCGSGAISPRDRIPSAIQNLLLAFLRNLGETNFRRSPTEFFASNSSFFSARSSRFRRKLVSRAEFSPYRADRSAASSRSADEQLLALESE